MNWTIITKSTDVHMSESEIQNSLETKITMYIHFKLLVDLKEARLKPWKRLIRFGHKEVYFIIE